VDDRGGKRKHSRAPDAPAHRRAEGGGDMLRPVLQTFHAVEQLPGETLNPGA